MGKKHSRSRKGETVNNPFQERRDKLNILKTLRSNASRTQISPRSDRPYSDTVTNCPVCNGELTKTQLAQGLYVCPLCGHHYNITAYYRLSLLMDSNTFHELDATVTSADPLGFPDYQQKLSLLKRKTSLSEAVVTCHGKIDGLDTVVAVLDSSFLMGSMSAAVGEKITRAVEYAAKKRLPLIIFSASGGARMQEGIFSLMQMAKTSAAIARFQQAGGLYISFFTHPTTGGVSASFAGLGDITLAEPNALIGFAGPRVIEQTIKQKLPEGFQRAEYLQDHGFVDSIVPRDEMRGALSFLLRFHDRKKRSIKPLPF